MRRAAGGGTYIFLRESWSAGYQPRGGEADSYTVAFTEERAGIVHRDGSIASRLEVIVSPEDDAEIRRVSLTNLGSHPRVIELTSYAEVVLAPPAADAAHPAFSNLFVRTECLPERDTLLATRRPRAPDEAQLWGAHVLAVEGETVGALQWGTDRAQFLSRGRGVRSSVSVTLGRRAASGLASITRPLPLSGGRSTPGVTAYLAIVERGRAGVYETLKEQFEHEAYETPVRVLWDRRHGERRAQAPPAPDDRRRTERPPWGDDREGGIMLTPYPHSSSRMSRSGG